MQLKLEPQSGVPGHPETTLYVSGDVLTVDGAAYDLSPVPEGGEGRWEGSPLVGPIRRINGEIHVSVIVQLGGTAEDKQPDSPWNVAISAGFVVIPAKRRPAHIEEELE